LIVPSQNARPPEHPPDMRRAPPSKAFRLRNRVEPAGLSLISKSQVSRLRAEIVPRRPVRWSETALRSKARVGTLAS
jgi:hypothetical protein